MIKTNEIEIVDVNAIDITDLPLGKCLERQVVFIEAGTPTIACLRFKLNGKWIHVPKDILKRNLEGPRPRESSYSRW